MGFFKPKAERQAAKQQKQELRAQEQLDADIARNSTSPEGEVSNQILEGLGKMILESNPPSVEVNYDDVGPAKVMVGHLNQNEADAQITVVDFSNYKGSGERHVAVGMRAVYEPAEPDKYHIAPKESPMATHFMEDKAPVDMDELTSVRDILKNVDFNQPGAVGVAGARHEQHVQANGNVWNDGSHLLDPSHIAAAQSAPAIESIPPEAEPLAVEEQQEAERANAPS